MNATAVRLLTMAEAAELLDCGGAHAADNVRRIIRRRERFDARGVRRSQRVAILVFRSATDRGGRACMVSRSALERWFPEYFVRDDAALRALKRELCGWRQLRDDVAELRVDVDAHGRALMKLTREFYAGRRG